MTNQKRNINPTPEAVVAMNLWGTAYAAQRGGSMDFWDDLSEPNKKRCAELVQRVLDAAIAHKRIPAAGKR